MTKYNVFLIINWLMQEKNLPYLNALLSDICISTSAAPTFFPAHHFTNVDNSGQSWDFNLIDGGVAANNPVINRNIYIYIVWY